MAKPQLAIVKAEKPVQRYICANYSQWAIGNSLAEAHENFVTEYGDDDAIDDLTFYAVKELKVKAEQIFTIVE